MPKSLLDLFLMTLDGGGEGGSSNPPSDPPENGSQGGEEGDKGFPANTPTSDMDDAQKAAYYKYQARKHETRSKNSVSKDDYQKLKDELDQLKQAGMSDQERSVEDARRTARSEGETAAAKQYQKRLVIAELRLATGQPEDALKYLDHNAFLTDSGEVDTDRVTEYADQTGQARNEQRRQDVERLGSMDAGKRGTHDGGKPSVNTGRERYLARVGKTNERKD
ncbi:MAG TPA: hypothetical protein H9871_02100 [Candidatus Nesterenkonia stercoripullorum]|uniref:Scaffolding protein n=1 Tax=Candidatus Nesterenkonia stercoripullorum TaxID=2838701 RepID=A0A9D1S121_9MICC|nr:hypothetical protein [Candidatus Nesterenkonia stercoripullorum]